MILQKHYFATLQNGLKGKVDEQDKYDVTRTASQTAARTSRYAMYVSGN